jgi:hypothetical protein
MMNLTMNLKDETYDESAYERPHSLTIPQIVDIAEIKGYFQWYAQQNNL